MTHVLCPCGGTIRPSVDSVTVEAGGTPVSRDLTEDHCDRCGMSLEEAAAKAERYSYLHRCRECSTMCLKEGLCDECTSEAEGQSIRMTN